jgi:hypothetical protein
LLNIKQEEIMGTDKIKHTLKITRMVVCPSLRKPVPIFGTCIETGDNRECPHFLGTEIDDDGNSGIQCEFLS